MIITTYKTAESMKHWEKYQLRKPNWKMFVRNHVPRHFLIAESGKYGISHTNGKCYPRLILSNIENNIEILLEDNKTLIQDSKQWFFLNVTTCLQNKSFVITGCGTFPRNVYKYIIELSGGVYTETISKTTTHLINLNHEQSKKLNIARKRNIKLISEIDLFNML
jgi:NAD-dependent DNA ligase